MKAAGNIGSDWLVLFMVDIFFKLFNFFFRFQFSFVGLIVNESFFSGWICFCTGSSTPILQGRISAES